MHRYGNILPYDHSRVKLSGLEQNQGYINASWIKTAGANCFIAAQGPLPHTETLFWKMIAENNVTVLVALTKLTEKDKNGKCMNHNIK